VRYLRHAGEVAAEMDRTGSRRFFIVDDNIVSQPAKARELCRALIPLGINWVGQHIPLHATSNGKILLSELDETRLQQVLGSLPSYTTRTITRKAPLIQELAKVREQGYAVAVDELEQGLTAVAAPIRSAHGDIIASMSVSGASFRLTGEALTSLGRE